MDRLYTIAVVTFGTLGIHAYGFLPAPGPVRDSVETKETTPLLSQRGLTTCSVKENEMAEMNLPGVEYRDVVGFPGYKIGSDGTLWTCRRTCQGMTATWRQLAGWKFGPVKQYVMANLRRDGKLFRKVLHRVVLEAFVGPCPDGMDGCHNNDIGTDNRLSNLRWDTRQANIADRDRNGKTTKGEQHWQSLLTEADVLRIREMAASGLSMQQIADQFPVKRNNISAIVTGQTWKHVGGPLRKRELVARELLPVCQRRELAKR